MDLNALLDQGHKLYQTTFPDGTSLVWRLLTLREYETFAGLRDQGVLPEMWVVTAVFERCYFGDVRLLNTNQPAGFGVSIGRLIMELSGDAMGRDQGAAINQARDAYPANSVHEVMKQVILLAFPGYLPEDIERWTSPQFLERFVLAETLLAHKGGYEPIDTRKFMSAEQAALGPQIDFAAENRELDASMLDDTHMFELDPAEFARRQKIAARMQRGRPRPRGK